MDISEDGGGPRAGLKRNSIVIAARASLKYDLSGWKQSELVNTIKTAHDTDLDLAEACRDELRRRQTVYDAWKTRRGSTNVTGLMPEQQMVRLEQQLSTASTTDPNQPDCQRYFRVQLTGEKESSEMVYAHFDGQSIVRHIKVQPDHDPILLMAGRDDMQVCKLKLNEETGLNEPLGIEIREFEFEQEWYKHGGDVYIAPGKRESF